MDHFIAETPGLDPQSSFVAAMPSGSLDKRLATSFFEEVMIKFTPEPDTPAADTMHVTCLEDWGTCNSKCREKFKHSAASMEACQIEVSSHFLGKRDSGGMTCFHGGEWVPKFNATSFVWHYLIKCITSLCAGCHLVTSSVMLLSPSIHTSSLEAG